MASQIPFDGLEVGTAARFSPDRKYRYLLTRAFPVEYSEGIRLAVNFIMLNPSTADERVDDPTIRRCIGFARAWGYTDLSITNLSPLRATDPKELLEAGPEPAEVWQENINTIQDMVWASDGVVVAWGVHGKHDGRADRVIASLNEVTPDVRLTCLGTTKGGQPWHPLYLPSNVLREPYLHGAKEL